jgi:hypothetical protein
MKTHAPRSGSPLVDSRVVDAAKQPMSAAEREAELRAEHGRTRFAVSAKDDAIALRAVTGERGFILWPVRLILILAAFIAPLVVSVAEPEGPAKYMMAAMFSGFPILFLGLIAWRDAVERIVLRGGTYVHVRRAVITRLQVGYRDAAKTSLSINGEAAGAPLALRIGLSTRTYGGGDEHTTETSLEPMLLFKDKVAVFTAFVSMDSQARRDDDACRFVRALGDAVGLEPDLTIVEIPHHGSTSLAQRGSVRIVLEPFVFILSCWLLGERGGVWRVTIAVAIWLVVHVLLQVYVVRSARRGATVQAAELIARLTQPVQPPLG